MRVGVMGMLLSAIILLAGALNAREPSQQQSQQPQMMQQMQARQQQMIDKLNAVLEQLRASTERLDGLVGTMGASQGEAKTEAIAAVVAELVRQRKDLVGLLQQQLEMMQQMHTTHTMQTQRRAGNPAENERH